MISETNLLIIEIILLVIEIIFLFDRPCKLLK